MRFLMTKDCYISNYGYKSKGEVLVLPDDYPGRIGKTWQRLEDPPAPPPKPVKAKVVEPVAPKVPARAADKE